MLLRAHAFDATGQRGFTLIEVMITVAIIAILGTIALPAYRDYVVRGTIPEATSALSSRQVQAEQYFQDNRQYTDVSAGNPNRACVADTSGKNFNFACTVQTANAFTVTATGKGSMAGFAYSVNETNTKTTVSVPAGWILPTPNTCWVTKKGGLC
jgi:type IV pilus assembly protein PilE